MCVRVILAGIISGVQFTWPVFGAAFSQQGGEQSASAHVKAITPLCSPPLTEGPLRSLRMSLMTGWVKG